VQERARIGGGFLPEIPDSSCSCGRFDRNGLATKSPVPRIAGDDHSYGKVGFDRKPRPTPRQRARSSPLVLTGRAGRRAASSFLQASSSSPKRGQRGSSGFVRGTHPSRAAGVRTLRKDPSRCH
jgi:hypothetical protein